MMGVLVRLMRKSNSILGLFICSFQALPTMTKTCLSSRSPAADASSDKSGQHEQSTIRQSDSLNCVIETRYELLNLTIPWISKLQTFLSLKSANTPPKIKITNPDVVSERVMM